ncbi:MAG TPA: hypothetical protein VKY22_30195 [Bradyrhizobium sp.]|nr:hypothetical protein [Bradyrhizobium sp.]
MSDLPAIKAPVEELLSRFPGPITLYPPREKWALLAAGSLPFVVIGGVLILDGDDHALWGWIAVIFFSIGLLVAATRLLPGAAALTLDAGGFAERALFVQRARARWRDVTDIRADASPAARADRKLVGYNDSGWKGSWLAGTHAALPGCNAALADTYGLSADDLAELMIRWQQQALEAKRHSPVDRLI